VAQLAGLPQKVIKRAKEILQNLEANELTAGALPKLAVGPQGPSKTKATPQLDLFEEQEQRLRETLSQIDPNQLTPLQALEKLFLLKKILDEK